MLRTTLRLLFGLYLAGSCAQREAPEVVPMATRFTAVAEVAVGDDGRTAAVPVTIPPGTRTLALRIRLPSDKYLPGVCFQLDDVRDDTGAVWVPAEEGPQDWGATNTRGSQRVTVGAGYGLFLFPNNGAPLPLTSALSLRVSLRDCATLLPIGDSPLGSWPGVVVVESVSVPAEDEPTFPHLRMDVALALPPAVADSLAAPDSPLAGALDQVTEAYAAAGIELEWGPFLKLPTPDGPVRFSAPDIATLNSLDAAADDDAAAEGAPEPAFHLIIVPSLERFNPLTGTAGTVMGTTPHLPAGGGVPGIADGIFVSLEDCSGDVSLDPGDARCLAMLIAHELGHALGLYHVREQNGQEDLLTDTHAQEANIMHPVPVEQSGIVFSESQAVVMRGYAALLE